MVLAHNQLGVDEDIATEYESRDASINQLRGGAVREKHHHEAHQNQRPESTEKVGHPACEVIFGLAGKDGQEYENASSYNDGVEDDFGVIEGDDHADGVGFEEGESREEEEIGRVGVALPVGQEQEDHCAE